LPPFVLLMLSVAVEPRKTIPAVASRRPIVSLIPGVQTIDSRGDVPLYFGRLGSFASGNVARLPVQLDW
jgi:hypothetical protein